jgi:SAM-dependent methyltransferase
LHTAGTTQADLEEHYDTYYSEDNLAAPDFVSTALDRVFSTFDPFRRAGRLLDVGFGGGFTLLAAVKHGWDAEGVEVSASAIKNAESLGLRVHHGDLASAAYPDDEFDVVILAEVLEHVTDPRPLLDDVYRVLRPGGLLWGTTPHGSGLSARLLGLHWSVLRPPEHLQLFSLRGMRHLLTTAGFSLDALVTEGFNPFEVLHVVRSRLAGSIAAEQGFDRVHSGYEVLGTVYRRRSLRMAKQAMDQALHVTGLGDSIKIWATKPPRPTV